MGYMLVTQSTEGFRNNRPPAMLRLIECTKEKAMDYAKAAFDELVKQENRVMLSHNWDEQKGVGIIKYYGGDEARVNLFDIVGSAWFQSPTVGSVVLEEFE